MPTGYSPVVKALLHRRFGSPLEVLALNDQQLGCVGEEDIVVDILASPIDPMDLLMIRGLYPLVTSMPAIPGAEGVGRIIRCGSKVRQLAVGDLVLMPIRFGAWCTQARVAQDRVLRLPPSIDIVQASMLRVNALSARVMLEEIRNIESGDWIIQSLGTSSVGQYVIQWAKKLGIRTISLVRCRQRARFLEERGADHIVEIGDDTVSEVKQRTKGAEIHLALDGHGAGVTETLARCLANNGLVLCYGAMSRKPAQLSVSQSVFRRIRLQGFWLYHWIQEQEKPNLKDGEQRKVDRYLMELAQANLKSRIDSMYDLEDFEAAISRAQDPQVQGRVLFRPNPA